MQTSLPDLPFVNYGNAVLDAYGTHSAAKSTPRTYPRTDLETLMHWTSFPNDIHQAIQSAITRANCPSTPFTIEVSRRTRVVANEEMIRAHAMVTLHEPVQDVLEMLGVKGSFALPGGGNIAIVGDPDFSWVMGPTWPHPKVIVEYKTWWAANLANFDISSHGACPSYNTLGESFHALQQIYGYMTFNDNKFGILTNWQHALFLRRAETSSHKTLEYYLVELGGPISMLKAWVGTVLLAEDDWFYASPTISRHPPSQYFETPTKSSQTKRYCAVNNAEQYHMRPVNGEYSCRTLDFRLCHFKLSTTRRGARGCVVDAQFLTLSIMGFDLQVICKVVDVVRYPDAGNVLKGEACAYAALRNLQGKAIPTVYGFYEVWGILQLLALEPVGLAIPEDEQIDQKLRKKMKRVLQHIHDAGFIHGDIARRNFCRDGNGDIFLVDLERCRPSKNRSELGDEMSEVDEL